MNPNNPVMRSRHGVFVLLLLTATAGTARGQSMLSGNVLTIDSTAIVGAHVTLHDPTGRVKGEALTDSAGGFGFRIANVTEPITLYITIVQDGFVSIELVPVRVPVSEAVLVVVHMVPNAVGLPPVTAVARPRNRSPTLEDYYDKLKDSQRGVGRGLDREVMRRYGGLELIKALQLVPGVEGGRSMLPEGVTLTVPKMRDGCIPITFLDRVPIAPEQLAVMDPAELEGVLVYVGGQQLPPDFSQLTAGTECGMILAYRIAPSSRKSTRSIMGIVLILGAFAAFASSAGW